MKNIAGCIFLAFACGFLGDKIGIDIFIATALIINQIEENNGN